MSPSDRHDHDHKDGAHDLGDGPKADETKTMGGDAEAAGSVAEREAIALDEDDTWDPPTRDDDRDGDDDTD